MPSAEEITRHHDPDPDEDPWVHGPPSPSTVAVVAYDPSWPDRYATLAGEVRATLGEVVLDIEHVGSTAVPGLAAKDVVDIDLTVADLTDEATYVPALEAIGWRHVVREPSWHDHRALSRSEPHANLHVFGPDCPETIRHRMFGTGSGRTPTTATGTRRRSGRPYPAADMSWTTTPASRTPSTRSTTACSARPACCTEAAHPGGPPAVSADGSGRGMCGSPVAVGNPVRLT